ncbi:hypothetical protein MMC21_006294 [Puttea exsequens]|nr:hypothetical protein [Puttea exsequens]
MGWYLGLKVLQNLAGNVGEQLRCVAYGYNAIDCSEQLRAPAELPVTLNVTPTFAAGPTFGYKAAVFPTVVSSYGHGILAATAAYKQGTASISSLLGFFLRISSFVRGFFDALSSSIVHFSGLILSFVHSSLGTFVRFFNEIDYDVLGRNIAIAIFILGLIGFVLALVTLPWWFSAIAKMMIEDMDALIDDTEGQAWQLEIWAFVGFFAPNSLQIKAKAIRDWVVHGYLYLYKETPAMNRKLKRQLDIANKKVQKLTGKAEQLKTELSSKEQAHLDDLANKDIFIKRLKDKIALLESDAEASTATKHGVSAATYGNASTQDDRPVSPNMDLDHPLSFGSLPPIIDLTDISVAAEMYFPNDSNFPSKQYPRISLLEAYRKAADAQKADGASKPSPEKPTTNNTSVPMEAPTGPKAGSGNAPSGLGDQTTPTGLRALISPRAGSHPPFFPRPTLPPSRPTTQAGNGFSATPIAPTGPRMGPGAGRQHMPSWLQNNGVGTPKTFVPQQSNGHNFDRPSDQPPPLNDPRYPGRDMPLVRLPLNSLAYNSPQNQYQQTPSPQGTKFGPARQWVQPQLPGNRDGSVGGRSGQGGGRGGQGGGEGNNAGGSRGGANNRGGKRGGNNNVGGHDRGGGNNCNAADSMRRFQQNAWW